MIAAAIATRNEDEVKKQYGVAHWIDDLSFQAANERLVSQPTINIEGLVGGYTGPGGKTVLPHRAVAKLDMRLVLGMKMDAAVAALKAHLAKRGYADIEVNVSGGYDPTSTKADARLIKAQMDVLKRVPGVGDAAMFGARDYAMRIWFETDRLTALNLTPNDIVSAIRAQNQVAPLGRIGAQPSSNDTSYQLNIRTTGRLESPEQFGNIVVRANADGSVLRLDAQSVCVHGDSPAAVAMARRIRDRFAAEGVTVSAFAEAA